MEINKKQLHDTLTHVIPTLINLICNAATHKLNIGKDKRTKDNNIGILTKLWRALF